MKPVMITVTFLCSGLAAACSKGIEDAAPQAASAAKESGEKNIAKGGGVARVTPAYLAGPWCLTHLKAGDQSDEENINYVFNEDGTLLYQNNSQTRIDSEGEYRIEGEAIEILPAYSMFNLAVGSAEEDEMVLDGGYMSLYWRRGAC